MSVKRRLRSAIFLVRTIAGMLAVLSFAHAGTPHLVRDINSVNLAVSSFPTDFADQGAWLFYTSSDHLYGTELYAIDNQRPVAAADSLAGVPSGGSSNVSVLIDDLDPDGQLNPASVQITSPPVHGTASVTASGVVSYTAASGYVGTDAFSYSASDDQGYASLPAQVQVTVVATATPPAQPAGGSGGAGLFQPWPLVLLVVLRRRRGCPDQSTSARCVRQFRQSLL